MGAVLEIRNQTMQNSLWNLGLSFMLMQTNHLKHSYYKSHKTQLFSELIVAERSIMGFYP